MRRLVFWRHVEHPTFTGWDSWGVRLNFGRGRRRVTLLATLRVRHDRDRLRPARNEWRLRPWRIVEDVVVSGWNSFGLDLWLGPVDLGATLHRTHGRPRLPAVGPAYSGEGHEGIA